MPDFSPIVPVPLEPTTSAVPVEAEVVDFVPKEAKQIADVPQELRGRLADRVKEHWEKIIDAQMELAKGIWVKDYAKDKAGNVKIDVLTGLPEIVKVYVKAPDRDAGQYLINQVIGKPKENTVVEGKVNFILDV